MSRYPSNLSGSNSNSGSRIARGGAGIDDRKNKRYRDILLSTQKNDKLQSPKVKRQIEERTDGLLNIIKSCESLKESYQST
jgi:hypothetical protein